MLEAFENSSCTQMQPAQLEEVGGATAPQPRPGQALRSPCCPWPCPLMKLKAEDPPLAPALPGCIGAPPFGAPVRWHTVPIEGGTGPHLLLPESRRAPAPAARPPGRPMARSPGAGLGAAGRRLRWGPGRSSSGARLAGGTGFPARRLGRRQNRRRGAGRAKPSDWSDGCGAGPAGRPGGRAGWRAPPARPAVFQTGRPPASGPRSGVLLQPRNQPESQTCARPRAESKSESLQTHPVVFLIWAQEKSGII